MSYKTISMAVIIFFLLITTIAFVIDKNSNFKFPYSTMMLDAYMENISATEYDQNGHIKIKLTSRKMTHFQKDDTTHLEFPHIILYRDNSPWFISSQFAKMLNGIDKIYFSNNVLIRHTTDDKTAKPTIIQTSELMVDTPAETAETTAFIVMTQPDLQMQARGMKANLKTGDITLLADSRGEYVPQI